MRQVKVKELKGKLGDALERSPTRSEMRRAKKSYMRVMKTHKMTHPQLYKN